MPCTPDETAGVEITTRDTVQDGTDNPLYATHEVNFSADVAAQASHVQITPQAGVTVLDPGKNGQRVDLVIPAPPSLTINVSWEQSTGTTECSASKTLTYPVLKVKPSTVTLIGKRFPARSSTT